MGYYYIAHHGIKGQKWGVRRYQNRDGTYTSAGLARKGLSSGGYRIKKSVERGAHTAGKQIKRKAKRAYNTVATYALGKNYIDRTLKGDTELSRIQTTKEFLRQYPFYATYKKHDVNEYTGLFGKNLKRRAKAEAEASKDPERIKAAKNMKVYQLKLNSGKNLRIASDQNAGKVVGNLVRHDKRFRKRLSASLADARTQMKRPSQQKLLSKGQLILKKNPNHLNDKDRRTLYNALNLTLTFHDENNQAIQKQFYGAMRKKGYGALIDANDKHYSSYRARNPLIVFDTSTTRVKGSRTPTDKEVDRNYKIYNTERMIKEGINQAITAIPNKLSATSNDWKIRDYDYNYVNPRKKFSTYS